MKKNYLLFFVFSIALLHSCKKKEDPDKSDNPANTCAECEGILAKSALDTSQKGVYKGLLLTGEGIGHFRLNYENGNTQTYLKLKYTRNKYETLLDSLVPTGTVVYNPSLTTFTLLGSAAKTSASLTTPPNNPSISDFTLSGGIGTGSKPQATMMKESSSTEVKVFEGTMTLTGSGSEAGKVGFVVKGTKIIGIITGASGMPRESFYDGTIGSDKKFKFSFSGNNSEYSGEFSTDNDIKGTIMIGGTSYGSFTAKRAY